MPQKFTTQIIIFDLQPTHNEMFHSVSVKNNKHNTHIYSIIQ